nr:hypothetical protein [Gammaproteobacteria bacterium]
MSDRFKPISEGLGSLLARLEEGARARADLTARVREVLPEPEKGHVLSVTYKDDTLVVLVDSAAWATHIKYAQNQLLARLRAAGETRFTKVKVRIGRSAPDATRGL